MGTRSARWSACRGCARDRSRQRPGLLPSTRSTIMSRMNMTQPSSRMCIVVISQARSSPISISPPAVRACASSTRSCSRRTPSTAGSTTRHRVPARVRIDSTRPASTLLGASAARCLSSSSDGEDLSRQRRALDNCSQTERLARGHWRCFWTVLVLTAAARSSNVAVALDDPVANYLPAEVRVPQRKGRR